MAFAMTIRQRMLALSLLGLAFVLAVAAVGYVAMGQLAAAAEEQSRASSALRAHLEADMMHDALRGDVLRSLLASSKGRQEELAEIQKDLAEHTQEFHEHMNALKALSLSAEIDAGVLRTQGGLKAYIGSAEEVVGLAIREPAAAEARLPAFLVSFKALEDDMGKLSDLIEAFEKTSEQQAAESSTHARWLLVLATLTATVLLLSINVYVGRGITQPLAAAVAATKTVADGDLTLSIEGAGQDETGQLLEALQRMNGQLGEIVGQVRDSADAIATGSSEIASGSLNLSQRTEQQASSLEQTAAAMDQLTATVKNNADTARRAAELALSAADVAARGGSAVAQVVSTMGDISSSSNRIADIIGVIDGIAFQTNILALNAAVEAARAGEQGRGFAVVAGEVRTLAQRSAEAAKEIKSLIADSVSKVEVGSSQVGEAGRTVQSIVSEVEKVSQLIAEISTASHEQSQGIGQVGAAVTQLDRMTQQNAALVEESAAAAESLKVQAARLASLVAQFKLRGH
ncbi:HAMP domain-containing protein [Pelomonas sp. V22]|uniref:methyl-accepting chemotaxis protein n=1 Tax=Pelomonas sp. V22 TaxID=2822139 RepID=UPI0024A96E2D|nr:methyl-accepting chemotaxis protein [Pelomonas sp. V22]MDI4631670.1 HAMP domain-containing protein [Pelomonas sp. V22]